MCLGSTDNLAAVVSRGYVEQRSIFLVQEEVCHAVCNDVSLDSFIYIHIYLTI